MLLQVATPETLRKVTLKLGIGVSNKTIDYYEYLEWTVLAGTKLNNDCDPVDFQRD